MSIPPRDALCYSGQKKLQSRVTKELIGIETSWQPLSNEDLQIVEAQLGRRSEGAIGVVRRCRYGRPQVIASAPLRVNGKTVDELPAEGEVGSVSIFPTLYWLTCPALRADIGRLESAGWVARIKDELQGDHEAIEGLRAAHQRTARIRKSLVSEATRERLARDFPGQYRVLNESGVAGMRPEGDELGVKCLHAHFADYLAHGKNPVGRRTWGLLTAGGVDPRGLGECFSAQGAACPAVKLPVGQTEAAIDVGSNSVRLLVAKRSTEGRFERMETELITIRLGADVAMTGRLGSEAIERTVHALGRLRARAAAFGVEDPVAVGTNALREAANREELLIRAWEEAGVSLRVISGEEEATLSFRGALTGFKMAEDAPVLLCDVGGGSTELILGRGSGQIEAATSLPYGAVRLHTEEQSGQELEESLERLRLHLHQSVLEQAATLSSDDPKVTLLCVGGTATTLAALDLEMTRYEPERVNGHAISVDRLHHWLTTLTAMEPEVRRELAGMPAGRADIMPYGLSILMEVAKAWQRWAKPDLLISDNDLLQGSLMLSAEGIGDP